MIDLDAYFAGYESVDEWYLSAYADHIYPTCPALKRTDPSPKRGQGHLYPEAGDVCGWCLRVWRSRKPDDSQEEK